MTDPTSFTTFNDPTDDNQLALDQLYQQITVLELVANLKNAGLIWHQVAPYQFQSTSTVGTDVYDFYLTKIAANGTIVLDVRKNATPYYFLNSNMDPSLVDFYSDMVDRVTPDAVKKDDALLSALRNQA